MSARKAAREEPVRQVLLGRNRGAQDSGRPGQDALGPRRRPRGASPATSRSGPTRRRPGPPACGRSSTSRARPIPPALPRLSPEELRQLYAGMMRSRLLDQRLLPLQRQGRIGFHIGSTGQEAGVIAGAHAIGPEDWFVPGLREGAAALYRGFPLRTYLAQVFGNENDLTHGRQMPCHSGSRASHHVVMSSCVSSQLPHATGLAMAARIRGDKVVTLGYCGDGGTSTEDFHVALNFAAVYKAPVVFVCQNNQWAISTPIALQTAAETIACKGLSYGLPAVRVDGNDIFAMYAAIREAVDRARAGGRPLLRRGPHLPPGRPQLVRRSHPLPRRGRARGLAQEGPPDPLQEPGSSPAASSPPRARPPWSTSSTARSARPSPSRRRPRPPPCRTLIEDVYAEPTWNLQRAARRPGTRARPTQTRITSDNVPPGPPAAPRRRAEFAL